MSAHAAGPAPALRPRRSPAQRRRRQAARIAIVAIALSVTVGSSAVATSGAFFTSGEVAEGNVAAAAIVDIGGTGPDADPTALLTVPNIVPLSEADALDNTKGVIVPLVVRNVGTVPFDWSVQLSGATSSVTAFTTALRVSASLDNGVTWRGAESITNMAAMPGTALAAPVAPATSQTTLRLRFWLDRTATNAVQGATATFTITTRAIQSGTPLDTAGVTYPTN